MRLFFRQSTATLIFLSVIVPVAEAGEAGASESETDAPTSSNTGVTIGLEGDFPLGWFGSSNPGGMLGATIGLGGETLEARVGAGFAVFGPMWTTSLTLASTRCLLLQRGWLCLDPMAGASLAFERDYVRAVDSDAPANRTPGIVAESIIDLEAFAGLQMRRISAGRNVLYWSVGAGREIHRAGKKIVYRDLTADEWDGGWEQPFSPWFYFVNMGVAWHL